MNSRLQINVTVTLPNGARHERAVSVSETAWQKKSFSPLPRNRELPFEYRAQQRAADQMIARETITNNLAKELATAIVKLIEREDPHNGFSSEEWRQINQQ